MIPPVESERMASNSSAPRSARSGAPPPPSTHHQPLYRPSSSSTYVASRDDQRMQPDGPNKLAKAAPYSAIPAGQNYYEDHDLRDKYTRNKGVGDVYSRGEANVDQDRNELFSGYKPDPSSQGRFLDGPNASRGDGAEGEGGEEDVEGIKQQTRFVKQESVNSTRNALRLAREAEETARNTLGRLGDQSG